VEHYEVEFKGITQVFVKTFEKDPEKTIWFNLTKFKQEKTLEEWSASTSQQPVLLQQEYHLVLP